MINNKKHFEVKKFVSLSLLVSIMILLGFTPIGIIDLVFIKATILHIPVIIGSIMLGPIMGASLGFIFGLISLFKNTFTPSLISFVFSPFIPIPSTDSGSFYALIICFVPRILVGVLPYFIYKILSNKTKIKQSLNFTICGIVGSAINSIFVMGFIYLLFKNQYASLKGISPSAVSSAIIGIIIVNGIPEAIVSAILVSLILLSLLKAKKKKSF